MKSPLVSIIIATYNCSHLLRHAVQSVINSDFQNWELIVVGDCCTDDTEEVVGSFRDDRILYFNLPQNSGQQATPNNFGLSKAQGEYIAFLNQDDLFYPDHLSKCVKEMEDTEADFIIVPGLKIITTKKEDFEKGKYRADLCSVHPDGKFSTNIFSVASTWFFKSEIAKRIGAWNVEKDLYVTPSQEWIFRANQKGVRFHFPSRVGVMVILSGERRNSYVNKHSFEHDFFSKRMNDPELKAKLLEQAAVFAYKFVQDQFFFQPKVLVKRVMGLPLDWVLKKFKIHPTSLRFRMVWGAKGNLIQKVRKDTGLD
ncbi:glycosyl transferase family 2 [Algoriphagus boseongensis]|uniref:Glycosyl transferase family 2 n=1 Tax=Algoriphagus boseongensis TaxID=1442587 RepID=A0A4R6T4R7_9BACT|nr:glycosyltransferase family 2 protein [Algoriphagus boseongensis]TDQ16944.1 glycosyl transferase family 2 [Algoriphagus boseongensis]